MSNRRLPTKYKIVQQNTTRKKTNAVLPLPPHGAPGYQAQGTATRRPTTMAVDLDQRGSTTRADRDCHPFLGWFGSTSPSWSSTSSAAPEARSSQEGGTKTSVPDTGVTGEDAWMLSASLPFVIARKMIRATSGWRSVIIFMLSAQLAQCAACFKLTALRRPNPPAARGRDAVSREDPCIAVESTPTREQKHSQIWLSWRVAKE